MLQDMNKIYLIGDSTCQTNFDDTFPQTGWGQLFHEYVTDDFEVVNLAKNGRSSKSFFDEGLFKPCEENLKEGDYLFIQFGHNDEKVDKERHTDPFTTYKAQLAYYVDFALSRKAHPVLISSIYRRQFIEEHKLNPNCHGDYPKAIEELAHEKNIPFINLTSRTKEYLEQVGESNSKCYFMNFDKNIYVNYMNGKEDNTHLREKGARMVCELLCDELVKNSSLKHLVK